MNNKQNSGYETIETIETKDADVIKLNYSQENNKNTIKPFITKKQYNKTIKKHFSVKKKKKSFIIRRGYKRRKKKYVIQNVFFVFVFLFL